MSIKKSLFKNCEEVQQYLAGNDEEIFPEEVQNHLNGCRTCRQYAATLSRLKEAFSVDRAESGLSPDLVIKQNLSKTIRQKNPTKTSLAEYIARIFTYRIPVYQVASALAVIILIFFATDYITHFSSKSQDIAISEISTDSEQFSSIYLLDSLAITGTKNIGRSALEDSAITKYMVTTL
jgi:predicted anti-sigma-YlaC factor YlaD